MFETILQWPYFACMMMFSLLDMSGGGGDDNGTQQSRRKRERNTKNEACRPVEVALKQGCAYTTIMSANEPGGEPDHALASSSCCKWL